MVRLRELLILLLLLKLCGFGKGEEIHRNNLKGGKKCLQFHGIGEFKFQKSNWTSFGTVLLPPHIFYLL